ncbi:hypothetical protein SAY87_014758 [Trapa incisa]|uniref:Protein SCAR n=1 Tax=Trapa incisa TaxID=236973 RepID=A0AAN7GWM4_9MYRT|nr:hypothetical protein SAY87_014758 [Trapa incisa]
MPLTRYLIRNEYSLGDPEVYGSADKDDPEALLEGIAMVGLVGLLRQLGDLAEFAAEIFHDLHEEVMATAARGHGLMVRIQQLEVEFPPTEKALLLQINHSLYCYNSGIECHPNLQMQHNLIASGDLPHFVMDSYEESRGPPRLFLLDKFDVAGAGACLKRYTDPSFFKVEKMPDNLATMEPQREKKVRKTKKKGARWRNGETPETIPASHAKLHQLFIEERINKAYNDPARRVKLKKRPLDGSPFNSKGGKSCMEKFVESFLAESKTICEVSVVPWSLQWKKDDVSESGLEVAKVSRIGPVKGMLQSNGRDGSLSNVQARQYNEDLENFEPISSGERDEVSSISHAAVEEKEIMLNGDEHREDIMDECNSDEITSEVENYMDALVVIESEIETDTDSRSRHNMTLLDIGKDGTDSDANEDMELHTDILGSKSVGNSASEDGNSSFEKSYGSVCNDGVSLIGATQFVGDRFSKMVSPSGSIITDSTNVTNDQLTHSKEPFCMELKALSMSTDTGIEADAACDIRAGSQPLSSPNLKNACAPIIAGLRSSTGPEQEETSPHCVNYTDGFSYFNEVKEVIVDSSTMASTNVPNQTESDNLPVNELEDDHPNGYSVYMEHSSDNLEPNYESKNINEVPNAGVVAESCNRILLRVDSLQSRPSLEEPHQFSHHAGEDVSADYSSSVSLSGDSDEEASGAGDEVNNALSSPVVILEKSTVEAKEQQVYVKDEKLLHEATNEGNLLSLDLQHKGGGQAFCQTLDSENVESLTYNIEACGGQSRDTIHPNIPYAGCDVRSESGEPTLIRVSLNNLSVILDESNVLHDQTYLDEMEEFPLHKENLPEGDIEKEERSCEGFTQDGQNKDGLVFNFEAFGGVCTSLIPPDGDDLITQGVQAGTDMSELSVVEVGVPQEREDFCKAISPGWNKESGLEKVNGEAAHVDLNPTSAVNWDFTTHGVNNAAVGFNVSSLAKQTQSGLVCERTSMNLEHAVLRLENDIASQSILLSASAAASEESANLLVNNKPAAHSHLTDGEISKSLNLKAEVVPSLDLLDMDSVCVVDAAPKLDSWSWEKAHYVEFQQVTGATQLLGHESEVLSPKCLNQERQQGSENMLENLLIQQPAMTESLQETILVTGAHNFLLLSEGDEANLLVMPPLPPLPPVQWRMGKPQNVPPSQEMKFPLMGLSLFPPLQPSLADENPHVEFSASEAGTPLSNPFLGGTLLSHNHFSSPVHLGIENPDKSCALQMLPTLGDPGNSSNDMVVKPLTSSLSPEPTFSEPSEQYFLVSDTKVMQASPQPRSLPGDTSTSPLPGSSVVEPALSMEQTLLKTDTEVNNLQHDTENAYSEYSSNLTDVTHDLQNPLNFMEEKVGSTDQQALLPKTEAGKPNGTLMGNIPRPPKPLIEAVAAHDRSKLRKVAELVRPQLAQKLQERDSLLEQIRTKSFNLKPATVARPNIQQGPKTDLKVAAILAKASAIRQALAGSDEDDDADSWSE